MFNTSILDPKVCAIPTFLNTLIILFLLYTLRTFKVSVELPTPILNDPPIDTVLGILLTKISWITPEELPVVIDFPNDIVSVLTPILNELVNGGIEVLIPEINTESWLFSSITGE